MATPAMTHEQLLTLQEDIAADPVLSLVPQDPDGAAMVVEAYNQEASPAFWVWRTAVPKEDFTNKPGPDGTFFVWQGNGFITRTVQEILAWQELFSGPGTMQPGTVNVALQNVRQAFADIFSGTGNAANNRTHLAAVGRRLCSRFERLYSTGTGSTAQVGALVVEGPLTTQDVYEAWSA